MSNTVKKYSNHLALVARPDENGIRKTYTYR